MSVSSISPYMKSRLGTPEFKMLEIERKFTKIEPTFLFLLKQKSKLIDYRLETQPCLLNYSSL